MTWVKICGTTNLEDALTAVDAGADAVGFVFHDKSPRNISIEATREIVGKLPPNVEKVGVFVGGVEADPIDISRRAGLTAAQIYPDFRNGGSMLHEGFLRLAPSRVIVAVPETAFDLENGDESEVISGFRPSGNGQDRIVAMLLDSGNSVRPGGTGTKFDWERAVHIIDAANRVGLKVIVAGGLSATNVDQAIGKMKPWGVDVVSGVEASAGKKDPEKVRAFVRAVREMDRKTG